MDIGIGHSRATTEQRTSKACNLDSASIEKQMSREKASVECGTCNSIYSYREDFEVGGGSNNEMLLRRGSRYF